MVYANIKNMSSCDRTLSRPVGVSLFDLGLILMNPTGAVAICVVDERTFTFLHSTGNVTLHMDYIEFRLNWIELSCSVTSGHQRLFVGRDLE